MPSLPEFLPSSLRHFSVGTTLAAMCVVAIACASSAEIEAQDNAPLTETPADGSSLNQPVPEESVALPDGEPEPPTESSSSDVAEDSAQESESAAEVGLGAEEPRSEEPEIPQPVEGLCTGALLVAFDEGAPRDRMTITNQSTAEVDFASVEFDLTNSAGRIIFDTRSGGGGVEVFQDFQVESGEAALAVDPVADDGSTSLRLDFTSFVPGDSFTFSIDVDDQLADSDLGQIQVTGAEIEGASVTVRTATADTLTATFGADSNATLRSSC